MSTTTTYTGVRIADFPDLGSVNDNSSVVGEHAGSGLFSAPALRSYVLNAPTIPGPATISGSLNLSGLPQAQPDGSAPVGAVRGDVYINGGFLCIAP